MRAVSWSAVFLLGAAAPLVAQNSQCTPFAASSNAFNVCNAAIDGTRAFQPILGLLTSGGTPVLGTPGNLGGFGKFNVVARVNATEVVLPDLSYNGATTTVPAGDQLFFPSPLIEGAVGVFGGTGSGLFAIDLLASAQLLPTTQIDNLTVDSTARHIGSLALGLGFGARVGLVRESATAPGVSVSIMRRNIPELRYGTGTGTTTYSFATNLYATNLRATVSKHLSVLQLAAGLGWDRYTGDATIELRDPSTGLVAPPIAMALASSRTLGFVDAGFDTRFVKLIGEAGYQLGKDENLQTTFEDFDPAAGRFFASVGLVVGI
jgi:hypothetical protein